MTTRDRQVLPRKQRELAAALGAPVFPVPDDHFAVSTSQETFRRALLGALDAVVANPSSGGRARAQETAAA